MHLEQFGMIKIVLLLGLIAPAALYCHGTGSRTNSNTLTRPQDASAQHANPARAEREESFFRALEERTRQADVPSLRTTTIDTNDLEMRFWYDARPDVINGFVIHRLNGQWSALGIRQTINRWPSPVINKDLGTPKSGWEPLWKKLVDAGLLTLPDLDQTKCQTQVLDGGAFVVETNVRGMYRTYYYSNPGLAVCDEAKQLLSIESIIADEFNLLLPAK